MFAILPDPPVEIPRLILARLLTDKTDWSVAEPSADIAAPIKADVVTDTDDPSLMNDLTETELPSSSQSEVEAEVPTRQEVPIEMEEEV